MLNDSSNNRLSVVQDLIDNIPQNGKVGVVKFASLNDAVDFKVPIVHTKYIKIIFC